MKQIGQSKPNSINSDLISQGGFYWNVLLCTKSRSSESIKLSGNDSEYAYKYISICIQFEYSLNVAAYVVALFFSLQFETFCINKYL